MTSDKGNQIRAKKIASSPIGDALKHPDLESHLKRTHPAWNILPQEYMTFTKGEDEYQFHSDTLTVEQVAKYKIAHPDYYITKDDQKVLLLELDGAWHDKHVKQTLDRNKLYSLNGFAYIAVSETELKFKLRPDIKPTSWKLSQQQINDEFDRRMK